VKLEDGDHVNTSAWRYSDALSQVTIQRTATRDQNPMRYRSGKELCISVITMNTWILHPEDACFTSA